MRRPHRPLATGMSHGQAMRRTGGVANPEVVRELIEAALREG